MTEKTYDAALRAQMPPAGVDETGTGGDRRALLRSLLKRNLRGEDTRGSLSIEAALLLPILLLFHLFLPGFFQIMLFQMELQESLQRSALMTAEGAAYLPGKLKDWAGLLTDPIFAWSIDDEWWDRMPVQSGRSSVVPVSYVKDDYLNFTVSYVLVLPPPAGRELAFQGVRQRCFTGVSLKQSGETEEVEAEQMVYRTQNGTVYHISPECSHIRITARAVAWAEVKELRNKSGGRYYNCEFCSMGGYPDPAYVTDYGNRYHAVKNCHAIRRDVIAIPISEAEGMRVCSRCGAQTGGGG